MRRLRTNSRDETRRQFLQHVTNRKFLARNTVVLLIVLVALIYQGSPFWVYLLVLVIYPGFMIAFEWLMALFWREDTEERL